MSLCPVDDLLSVVQQESSEEDETSVDCDRVEPSSHSGGRWEEGRAKAGTEDNSKSHGQGTSHVEELVAGGTDSHGGETTHHASSVPGSSGEDGPPQQADRSDHGANDGTVSQPGQLLGAQCTRLVGDGAGHHA